MLSGSAVARALAGFIAFGFAALAVGALSAAEAGGAPAMWRLKDDNSEIYLFGTMHLLPPDLQWTTPAFDAAMEATGTTVTETDLVFAGADEMQVWLLRKYGTNPPGVTLSSILGPERAAALRRFGNEVGVPYEALEPLRPWAALVALTSQAYLSAGFEPASGVEEVVRLRARREGDRFAILEKMEQQIRILADIDEDEILASFEADLKKYGDFEGYMQTLLTAWQNGDLAAIEARFILEMRESSPISYEVLIASRNRNWAAVIETVMAGKGGYFIAVGAGHLVGEDSVIALLEKRGFAVERVQ